MVAASGCAPPYHHAAGHQLPSGEPLKCRTAAALKVSNVPCTIPDFDVDQARGHLAIHRQAEPLQAIELRDSTIGRPGLSSQSRPAALPRAYEKAGFPDCTEAFHRSQLTKRPDDGIKHLPTARGAAVSPRRSGVRIFGDIWIEIVHQHAGAAFLMPSFSSAPHRVPHGLGVFRS
jgi:hypothetical protein